MLHGAGAARATNGGAWHPAWAWRAARRLEHPSPAMDQIPAGPVPPCVEGVGDRPRVKKDRLGAKEDRLGAKEDRCGAKTMPIARKKIVSARRTIVSGAKRALPGRGTVGVLRRRVLRGRRRSSSARRRAFSERKRVSPEARRTRRRARAASSVRRRVCLEEGRSFLLGERSSTKENEVFPRRERMSSAAAGDAPRGNECARREEGCPSAADDRSRAAEGIFGTARTHGGAETGGLEKKQIVLRARTIELRSETIFHAAQRSPAYGEGRLTRGDERPRTRTIA